mmetsp:Transcript_34045/g.78568  ORF Transcript_34045/g.78568 Transcript_34045/m.78568 type:complete len:206 (+) Transcript_34045:87-704(+)
MRLSSGSSRQKNFRHDPSNSIPFDHGHKRGHLPHRQSALGCPPPRVPRPPGIPPLPRERQPKFSPRIRSILPPRRTVLGHLFVRPVLPPPARDLSVRTHGRRSGVRAGESRRGRSGADRHRRPPVVLRRGAGGSRPSRRGSRGVEAGVGRRDAVRVHGEGGASASSAGAAGRGARVERRHLRLCGAGRARGSPEICARSRMRMGR